MCAKSWGLRSETAKPMTLPMLRNQPDPSAYPARSAKLALRGVERWGFTSVIVVACIIVLMEWKPF